MSLAIVPIQCLANATIASGNIQSYVTFAMTTICTLATLTCTLFLAYGGIQYITSTGKPEKLGRAKTILKNALLGLVVVLAAGTITAILAHSYPSTNEIAPHALPSLQPIQTEKTSDGLIGALLSTITALLQNIIQSIGEPFLKGLSYFTNSTPLMSENPNVFNLWLAILAIADILFILAISLIGFQLMSASVFGLSEVNIKHILPRIALVFLLMNTSIFIIDGVISLSNAMIYALQSSFQNISIWDTLIHLTQKSLGLGIAGLLVMIAFLIVSIMLLIYYVSRLITLYIGAILSPLLLILALMPTFKDFTLAAFKVYLTTIFVLFVHVVILLLASSIFSNLLTNKILDQSNTLMGIIIGLATIISLLKTPGVMKEFSYAVNTPRVFRQLTGQFLQSISTLQKTSNRSSISMNHRRSNFNSSPMKRLSAKSK